MLIKPGTLFSLSPPLEIGSGYAKEEISNVAKRGASLFIIKSLQKAHHCSFFVAVECRF